MTDDSKLKMNDTWSENSTYSPKRRRIESGNGKSLRILLIILLILIFAGGIIYFLSKGPTGGNIKSLITTLKIRESMPSESSSATCPTYRSSGAPSSEEGVRRFSPRSFKNGT